MIQVNPNLRGTVLASPLAEAVIPLVPPNDDQLTSGVTSIVLPRSAAL